MHKSRGLVPGQSREEARAGLRPGNFQGRPPRGRSHAAEVAAMKAMDDNWFGTSRFKRRARVVANDPLTPTGTFLLRLEAVDGEPFDFAPGQFVGIEAHFEGVGYRRSPYCILSGPADAPGFDLMVRAVPDGPLSLYLAELEPGDEVLFRGPTGRPMAPRFSDRELVLLSTGTGIAPLISLARHLLVHRLPAPHLAVVGAPTGRGHLPHRRARRPRRHLRAVQLRHHPLPAAGRLDRPAGAAGRVGPAPPADPRGQAVLPGGQRRHAG